VMQRCHAHAPCMLHCWKKGHWSRFVTPISPGCSNRD
jgi:hypothetical protein